MSLPVLAPAGGSADLQRYEVRSRVEILALLRALIERRAPATVHFDHGEDFIVSTLLAVNPDFEELVLDPSGDEAANRRLLRSQRMTVVSRLDRVRIQFVVQGAQLTAWNKLPALRVRIPRSVLRLQRRDSYRIAPPIANPLSCGIPDPAVEGRRHALRILDISCGGVALLVGEEPLPLEPGMVLGGCVLSLPGIGEVSFAAEVRNVSRPGDGDAQAMRCGLRFIGMAQRTVTLIQRYILKLERDRIART
jgi:c-di-GMP-binding flagellar brake protein YcgR